VKREEIVIFFSLPLPFSLLIMEKSIKCMDVSAIEAKALLLRVYRVAMET
jgi:hypothetical protein